MRMKAMHLAIMLFLAGFIQLLGGPPHSIRHQEDLVLMDLERFQELSINLYHPDEAGEWPIIIFSHAEGGNPQQLEHLGRAWAESGWISIFPHHKDFTDGPKDHAWVQSAFPEFQSSALLHQSGIARVQDVKFLMDALEQVQMNTLPRGIQIRHDRIGLGGYAFGAYTQMQLAGARVKREDPMNEHEVVEDSRPMAFLFISPPGTCDQLALDQSSWDRMTRPMMVVTGQADIGPKGEPGSWRRAVFEKSPPGDKFMLWFERGLSRSFISPPPAEVRRSPFPIRQAFPSINGAEQYEVFKSVRDATLLFWRAYLDEDPDSRDLLEIGELPLKPAIPHSLLQR